MSRWKLFDLQSDIQLTLTPSLTLGLGLGLTPGKTKTVENLKPNAKHQYRRKRPGKNLWKMCRWKLFYLRSDLKITLILSWTLRLGLGLTPGKTKTVENLKPNAKHQYRRTRTGKNLMCRWKLFDLQSDLQLTLTLSLTLGLGLGLTPGKTKTVENLKPNAKHQYRRKRPGKNLWKMCRWKLFYLRSDLKITLTLSWTLGLGLGLTPGKTKTVEIWNQMQNINIVVHEQGKIFKRCVDGNFLVFKVTFS